VVNDASLMIVEVHYEEVKVRAFAFTLSERP
jgi:hypothetical protein